MATYPDRVRLPRGKHVHAAESVNTTTACRKHFDLDIADWLDEAQPVTCPKCLKELSW